LRQGTKRENLKKRKRERGKDIVFCPVAEVA